jgi:hypothetical protein
MDVVYDTFLHYDHLYCNGFSCYLDHCTDVQWMSVSCHFLSTSFLSWKHPGALFVWNHLDIFLCGLYFQDTILAHNPH